jgi:prepilin-type N-terminal cleavage/methylation domain-containing protein
MRQEIPERSAFTLVELPVVSRRKGAAFTLVELLVVIAIIGILVALLLPAIQSAREAARRTTCQNNMKQLGLATLNYESSKKELPPGHWQENLGSPFSPKWVKHSVITYILPYMEETAIADRWNFDETWYHIDAAKPIDNWRLCLTPIPTIICPSALPVRERNVKSIDAMGNATLTPGATAENKNNLSWPGATDYAICEQMSTAVDKALAQLIGSAQVAARANKHGRFESILSVAGVPGGPMVRPKLSHCTDGLSQSLMWFETAGRPIHYVEGVAQSGNFGSTGDTQGGLSWAQYDNEYWVHDRCGTSMMNCNNQEEIYSFHPGGCFFVLGDGAVRFVQDSIDPLLFVALFTRDGNDIIDPNSF